MFNAQEAAVITVPRLELVRKAGRQYAKVGAIDAALLVQIGSPMISEETLCKDCERPGVRIKENNGGVEDEVEESIVGCNRYGYDG